MGILASTLGTILPYQKSTAGSAIATWDNGRPQTQPWDYARGAKEGYMADELVYDCVELRATSAGEPPICAWKLTDAGEEKITQHPLLTLLNRPNPFMGRSMFWAAIMMHLDVGGNAYIEKVRSPAGKIKELWLLRPDRVKVIPDEQTFVGGYTYTIGDKTMRLPADDVIHFRTRHPLNDYYGLAPLAVLAGRVDLDVFTRQFMEAFFRNAGVPAGLLNIKRTMTSQERGDTQRRFREQVGGIGGWHKVLVLDSEVVTYTPMGLPVGSSGLAMPEMNSINETRILGVYGVPMSLVPTMVGHEANRGQSAAESDRELFWEQTMIPVFRDLDSMLSVGLLDEFPDLDRLEHDLSTVKALQEDEDKKAARWLSILHGSGCTVQEFRQKIGLPEEPDEPGVMFVASTSVPTPSDALMSIDGLALDEEQDQQQALDEAAARQPALPVGNGRTNGAAH